MKGSIDRTEWQILDKAASSMDAAAEAIRKGEDVPEVILVKDQTAGRGRLGRTWVSNPGESLSMSILFPELADHPKPWLIAMACAAAAAGAIHARLQWPNDLILDGKKVGGILAEMITDPHGRRIPVVGIGINLTQTEFSDDLAERAISLAMHRPGGTYEAETAAQSILSRLDMMPVPQSWSDIAGAWTVFDSTPGKKYTLPSGEEAVGIGIGPEAELICAVDGETTSVMAADAHFGGE